MTAMTMNRPTIVRTMPELELEAACTAVLPLRCSGAFSPVPEAAKAAEAGVSVRAPTSAAPRVSVSDFIEGTTPEGGVIPVIGRGRLPLNRGGAHGRRGPPVPGRRGSDPAGPAGQTRALPTASSRR